MDARVEGAGDAKDVVRDVIAGRRGRKSNVETEVIAARVPLHVARDVRDAAARRGVTVNDVVLQRLAGKMERLDSQVVSDARPWAGIAYRMARALDALGRKQYDAVETCLREAQRYVADRLLELRKNYDADVDALEEAQRDDWSKHA